MTKFTINPIKYLLERVIIASPIGVRGGGCSILNYCTVLGRYSPHPGEVTIIKCNFSLTVEPG